MTEKISKIISTLFIVALWVWFFCISMKIFVLPHFGEKYETGVHSGLAPQEDISVHEARKFISDCKAAGGEPVYDLCAEKGFRVIKLEGYKWSDEVDEYNNQ